MARVPSELLAPGEQIIRRLCEQAHIPWPTAEYRFHPTRKWRFDFAWEASKVALEIEGGAWIIGRHNRAQGFLDDLHKYNAAVILGWRVLRYTPKQLSDGVLAVRLLLGVQ